MAIRALACLIGVLAALPLVAVLALLPSTPLSLGGWGYLLGYALLVVGLVSAPWRQEHYHGLVRGGLALLALLVVVRVAFPARGSWLTLTTLPEGGGPRWVNRLFDEQDIALFGERIAYRIGFFITEAEDTALVDDLHRGFVQARREGATPLSPFLATSLGLQSPTRFDALLAAPPGGTPARAAVVFLHGFGGNFTLQCWLVARAARQAGLLTICPSVGVNGSWGQPHGSETLQRTLDELRRRGVERFYLAGLSNGALGASRLAGQLKEAPPDETGRPGPRLAGLILISGADPEAPPPDVPVLLLHGTRDERMPSAPAERYARQAGAQAQLERFDSDHFLLARRADQLRDLIAAWLSQREADSAAGRGSGGVPAEYKSLFGKSSSRQKEAHMQAAQPEQSRVRRATAIAMAYAAHPEVEAVALAGSQTSGTAEPGSDLDLYIYTRGALPVAARARIAHAYGREAEVDNQFWEPGDEWVDQELGIGVDVMFREVSWIEDVLEGLLSRHQASIGYSTAFWHNLRTSLPLFDRRGWFAQLQRTGSQPYPDELQRAIVAKNYPILRQTHSSYLQQLARALERRDLVSLNHRVAALLASYFDILFAVNRQPHPGEKRLVQHALASCHRRPPELQRQVEALLAASASADEQLLARAGELLDGLDQLLDEAGLRPG